MIKRNIIILLTVMMLLSSCSSICEKADWIPLCPSEMSLQVEILRDTLIEYDILKINIIRNIKLERIRDYYNERMMTLGFKLNDILDEGQNMDEDSSHFEEWKSNISSAKLELKQLNIDYNINKE